MAKTPTPPNPTISGGTLSWRNFGFWRNIYLYFWTFALGGHLLELLILQTVVSEYNLSPNSVPTLTPIAAPYGLGAVAFILFVLPIFKRLRKPRSAHGVLLTFVLSAITGGITEYICATVIVAADGTNIYWDYSRNFLNLQGYISFGSVTLFGLLAILFFYFLLPTTENLLAKTPSKILNIIFSILFTTYLADLIVRFVFH